MKKIRAYAVIDAKGNLVETRNTRADAEYIALEPYEKVFPCTIELVGASIKGSERKSKRKQR